MLFIGNQPQMLACSRLLSITLLVKLPTVAIWLYQMVLVEPAHGRRLTAF